VRAGQSGRATVFGFAAGAARVFAALVFDLGAIFLRMSCLVGRACCRSDGRDCDIGGIDHSLGLEDDSWMTLARTRYQDIMFATSRLNVTDSQ
jgi:hypothetical protein